MLFFMVYCGLYYAVFYLILLCFVMFCCDVLWIVVLCCVVYIFFIVCCSLMRCGVSTDTYPLSYTITNTLPNNLV